jgi:cob(I)alamin adenosyltransferase
MRKIYTGGGDRGKTSLFSGERISKSAAQLRSYGNLDELNSIIGALIATLPAEQHLLQDELYGVQSDLFHLSAWLATSPNSPVAENLTEISSDNITKLEHAIDWISDQLPDLNGFILPGGHISSAWAHLARTVCRRCERDVVDFYEQSYKGQVAERYRNIVVYLNRLSDYFFVLARYCNLISGVPEKRWQK